MNIDFRDSNRTLYSKNILDIDLDMKISESISGKYVININDEYVYDEEFDTAEEAEVQLKHLSQVRNHLENELRNEG